ncbi:MAG: ABC transporter permease, partial [Saprospiraceae bacterium]
ALFVLIFIAVFADFIANDKPIVAQIDNEIYFPVLRESAMEIGLRTKQMPPNQVSWDKQTYDWKILPLIPYAATTFDLKNSRYVSPFAEQRVESLRYWHWLGTDKLGRDVAAGMVAGTRVAMLVGVISMSIAAVIGIFFGAIAGYFGDNRLKVSRIRIVLNLIGLIVGFFYGFIVRSYTINEAASIGWQLFLGFIILVFTMLIFNGLASLLKRFAWFGKKLTVPADLLVMRSIEIMNSIPTLLLLLSIVAVINKPSVLYVMVIIGLIRWTGIARFMRAELLKVRNLEYIEAAQAMGFNERRIIFRHAIPNALTPVLITIAFGIASAILLEAFLSFLNLGVAADEVTWGSLLRLARENFSAWWLAIFPGLAIFVTVTIFNLIGEGLTEALDPKLIQGEK